MERENVHPNNITGERQQDHINDTHAGDNGEGWKTVSRRRTKEKNHKINTISYFFTDFPAGSNEGSLWKIFAKHGRIMDVYIAKKKAANGKAFSFARFIYDGNPKILETTLNTITFGSHPISVNIAKYQHGKKIPTPQNNKNRTPNISAYQPLPFTNKTAGKTYLDILSAKTQPAPPTPITIHSCPDLTSSLAHSLVGELVTIDTLPNLHTICQENDVPNIRIKYLGGFHVLMIFDHDTTAQTLLSKPSIVDCFKTLNPWSNKFHLKNRLTWLAIEGLPPQAWHEAAFTRIAGDWGEIVFPEKCNYNSNNLVAGKVFALTEWNSFNITCL
ncbi:RNA-directed DNA polymerase, eukaryota [Tanacetum coccineum]